MLLKCRFYSQGTAAGEISDTSEELDKIAKLHDGSYEAKTAGVFVRPEVLSGIQETKPQQSETPLRITRTETIKPSQVKTNPPRTNSPKRETPSEKPFVTRLLKTDTDIEPKENLTKKVDHNEETTDHPVTADIETKRKKNNRKTIKLEFTLTMYYLATGILVTGVLFQIIIAYLNRQLLFAYVTQLWFSFANIMVIGAALFSIFSKVSKTTCKYSWYGSLLAIGCLSLANFLMTLYKFILIRFPVGRQHMTTVKKQILWCIGAFFFVAIVSSPIVWLKNMGEHLVTSRGFCHYSGGEYTFFIVAWICVALVTPMILNLSMFLLIGLKVVEHKRKNEERRSRFVPLTQETTLTTVNEPESDNDALLKHRKSTVRHGNTEQESIQIKTYNFPPIIIATMILTVLTSLPFVPAMVNPSWFYMKKYKTVLDILYGVMLISIALSPFLQLWFSKKTKETVKRLARRFINNCKKCGNAC